MSHCASVNKQTAISSSVYAGGKISTYCLLFLSFYSFQEILQAMTRWKSIIDTWGISSGICQWKNFENQSSFAELWMFFLERGV